MSDDTEGNSLLDMLWDLPCCARNGSYCAPDCSKPPATLVALRARFNLPTWPPGTPNRGRFERVAEGLLFVPDGGA